MERTTMVMSISVDDLEYLTACKTAIRKIREEVAERGTIRDNYLFAVLAVLSEYEKAAD